jgi:hypothetical protein
MGRFIEGEDCSQIPLLPDCLDDYVCEDNPVRAAGAFICERDLKALGLRRSRGDAVMPPGRLPERI